MSLCTEQNSSVSNGAQWGNTYSYPFDRRFNPCLRLGDFFTSNYVYIILVLNQMKGRKKCSIYLSPLIRVMVLCHNIIRNFTTISFLVILL